MQDEKKVFVTGASGNQGGAAVQHLLAKGFRVKALVRNPDSPKAASLARENVEIVKGDLNDPSSYAGHLQDCAAVFCNLHFTEGVQKEIKQGISLVTLAKEHGVGHFVYSSVIACDQQTGIPHWESKFTIENHIRSTGIPYTILRPASLFENLSLPPVKSRIAKGKLVLPTKADKIQQFISAHDIGLVSAAVLSNPGKYNGSIINLAAEQMDGRELAALFSAALNRPIKFQLLPMFITRLVMGRDLTRMFRWINQNDMLFVKDIPELKKEFPGMLPMRNWIKDNF